MSTRICRVCSTDISAMGPKAIYCGVTCRNRAPERRAAASAWRKANPDRVKVAKMRRRTISPEHRRVVLPRDVRRMVHRYRGMCAYCGVRPYEHKDHIYPVIRGGRFTIGNLLPACANCNHKKGTRVLSTWRYLEDGSVIA